MKTVFLNVKTNQGIETVDELREEEFSNYKEFKTELKKVLNDYKISGNFYNEIYTSQKSTNVWRQKKLTF